jgi:hypothetical protein
MNEFFRSPFRIRQIRACTSYPRPRIGAASPRTDRSASAMINLRLAVRCDVVRSIHRSPPLKNLLSLLQLPLLPRLWMDI